MKILFVSPHPTQDITFSKTAFSPLTLKQLAAITPIEHAVEIVDEKFKKINFEKDYDIVGISLMTYNSLRGYWIADEFRRRGKTVVLGGYHVTALPLEAKQHADSVVIGEAELTLPQLLQDYSHGKLKPFYRPIKFIEAKLIPPALHNIGSRTQYIDSIQATRGCPVGCEFCSIRNVEGTEYRKRSIQSIIEEMKGIKSKNLFFADSSLTIDPSFSKTLFKEMTELNKTFTCFGNINVLMKDEELLKTSAEAGCLRWLIGIESFNQDNLNIVGKRTNKVKFYINAIKKIKDYGLNTNGMFMFGFDNDTVNVFNDTVNAILQLELDAAFFNILTPYPGTPVFDKLEKEGRILTKDWSRYLSRCVEQSVVFQPKNMTPDQLGDGALAAAKNYYSFSNIARRCLKPSNLDLNHFIRRARGSISTHMFYKKIVRF